MRPGQVFTRGCLMQDGEEGAGLRGARRRAGGIEGGVRGALEWLGRLMKG